MKIDTIQSRSNPKLQDVEKYTTRKELLKELLIMLPLAIIGYGIMAVVALI